MNRRRCSLLILGALVAGCASAPPFPERSASAEISSGQFQYVGSGRSVVGEFVLARQGNDVELEFTKGGMVPLMKVARRGSFAWAEGAFARGHWAGDVANVSARLRGWLVEVPRAMVASSKSPRRSRIEVAGGQPGEKFVFIFAR